MLGVLIITATCYLIATHVHLIDKDHPVIVQLLDDHVAHRCLPGRCTPRHAWRQFKTRNLKIRQKAGEQEKK